MKRQVRWRRSQQEPWEARPHVDVVDVDVGVDAVADDSVVGVGVVADDTNRNYEWTDTTKVRHRSVEVEMIIFTLVSNSAKIHIR